MRISPEKAMERLKGTHEIRPLLKEEGIKKLIDLLNERKMWYRWTGKFEVDAERDAGEVAEDIRGLLSLKNLSGRYLLRHSSGTTLIYAGKNLLHHVNSYLPDRSYFLICSKRLFSIYEEMMETLFKKLKIRGYYLLPDGEIFKNVHQTLRILEEMSRNAMTRKDALIALGGGVVGDVGGFAASIYMRGIDWMVVPTTLLSQVDSSIGGKVGVNTKLAKNILGSFHQPSVVLTDINFLRTMSDRAFRSGLAEIIKYALIMDEELFYFLEENREKILRREEESLIFIITRAIKNKCQIVEEDEKEKTGRRRILNFGHTFGHIFESALGYRKINHGEAVAEGMKVSTKISRKINLIGEETERRILHLIDSYGFKKDVDVEDVEKYIYVDKKAEGDKIHFVAIEKIGCAKIIFMEIRKALKLYKEVRKC